MRFTGYIGETGQLTLLCEIGNGQAIAGFLANTVLPHYDPAFNGAIVVASPEMGAETMGEFLCTLVGAGLSSGTEGIVDLADRLCRRLDDGTDRAWRDALREMVAAICREFPSIGEGTPEDDLGWPRVPGLHRTPSPLPVETLSRLFALAWRFGLHAEADQIGDFFVGRPELVPPDRTIPALVVALHAEQRDEIGTGAAFATLWRHAADYLLSRSEAPPRPSPDWAMPAARLSCRCEPCHELRRFCADPSAQILRIAIRKELRRHLRDEIRRADADIRCETERRGSPYTLVCVKTRATYERELRRYRDDIVDMRRLVAVSDAVPDGTGIAEALRAAIGRSQQRER